jgi:hypothetical protein
MSIDCFSVYCKDKQECCGEPADENKSKVCYWCVRAYHHATRHMIDKIRAASKLLIEDNQDNR